MLKTDFAHRDLRSVCRYIKLGMPLHRLWCAVVYRRRGTALQSRFNRAIAAM